MATVDPEVLQARHFVAELEQTVQISVGQMLVGQIHDNHPASRTRGRGSRASGS